eukprot:scaffold682203_cov47-Prasinocladus_malaysianus.AAC.1
MLEGLACDLGCTKCAVLGISLGDVEGQLGWEGVSHGVEGLYGREPSGGNVPAYLSHEPLKQLWPIGPVADALEGVYQVGKGLREVGPEGQGALVGGDGQVVTGRILVAAGQVGVSLG